MKKIVLLSLLIVSSFGLAQEPVIEWQKSLGGTGGDMASSIQQTTNGGYIVTGWSTSNDGDVTGNNGSRNYWIVKLDATGNITWETSLGSLNVDYAYSIQQTTDGGYIVAGVSTSNDGDVTGNHGFDDYWVVKLDATGNITWQKSLGGTGIDWANSIQQTTDGGYIVAGRSDSNDGDVTGNNGSYDYWVVKLDPAGSITWQKSLGGSGFDEAYSIQQTTDGGYVVAGWSDSNDADVTGNHGLRDNWVVKLDPAGNITWQQSLGGTGGDMAYSIQQTSEGGYIVAGWSDSNDGDVTGNHGQKDYWIIKLDAAGNITWQKSLGGSADEWAESVKQTEDGGYVVAGITASNDGNITENNGVWDYWVIKLDANGNTTWQKSLGGSGYDFAMSIQQTTDEGYIIAGASGSSLNDGDVTGNHGDYDFWVVKLSPETSSIDEKEALKLNVYPNPTTETFKISSGKVINSGFKIIDAQGKEVLTGNMNGKEQTVEISNLSKGVYSVVFDNSELLVLSVIKE